MSGNPSYLVPRSSPYDRTTPTTSFPGCNIPQEDLDHAWALIKKYPPQIVIWIIRELLSQQPMDMASFTIPISPSGHTSSSSSGLTIHTAPRLVRNAITAPPFNLDSLCRGSEDPEAILNDTKISESAPISSSPEGLKGFKTPNRSSRRRSAPSIPPIRKNEGLKQDEKRWFCVFDEHRDKSFGKRSDWKKHMNGFHEPGKIAWQCWERDCRQIFVQDSNFCQHHRLQHACRKPCKHANSAKKRIPLRRAFACGCQSCQGLLFSWDEWRDHVARHMENGMTISQWQYNTLLRNLLRRPEVHPYWEAHVAGQVFPYHISARFNWRSRNTTLLKWHLEHDDEADLKKKAKAIALQAYETGLEVRSAQELGDPSVLIAEPIKQSSEVFKSLDLTPQLQHSDSDMSASCGMQLCQPRTPLSPQELTGQFPDQYLLSVTEQLRNDIDAEQLLGFNQFLPPLDYQDMPRDIASVLS